MAGPRKSATDSLQTARLEWQAGEYRGRIERRLAAWEESSLLTRLWDKDPTIWFPDPRPELSDRLGWLELPGRMLSLLPEWADLGERVKYEGYEHVVLLGMGGSSLAPEVYAGILGRAPGFPELHVLDSTHPDEIRALEKRIRPERTLFLVSSKSGTTLETLSLFRYFWSRLQDLGGKAADRFAAVTDPGSALEVLARERGFRKVFLSPPDVGGRYSALAPFGLVPAALMGLDVRELLASGAQAARAHSPGTPPARASGAVLGAVLGEPAGERNKVTFLASESLNAFTPWLEQLIAESTGKDGRGILPVVDETAAAACTAAHERIFVFMTLEGDRYMALDSLAGDMEKAGHPVVRLHLDSRIQIASEMFNWEVGTALASSILGVHPFDQPDVQLSKELTGRAMQEGGGEAEGVDTIPVSRTGRMGRALREFVEASVPGGYFTVQAFLPGSLETREALREVRERLQALTGLAGTLGFGPRFLHSTGQLHKGGPPGGLSLQLVDEPESDLPVPETDYSFARLIGAQSLGDYHALRRQGRTVMRLSLGRDRLRGLEELTGALGKIPLGD
jgi:transaldolase/glucose-6-phosphate isomerase